MPEYFPNSNSEPSYKTLALPNGLRMAFRPMAHTQSVSAGIWVKVGGRYENPSKAGISHMLEHLVFKGTRHYSCEELKQRIEGIGGSLNGFTAEEFTCYTARVLQRHVRFAIEILSEMVRRPKLDPNDLEKERDVIIEEIRMYEDTPSQFAHDLFSQLLWPNHPLGMLLSGTIDSVRRLTHKDVVEYWKRMYRPSQILISCAGSFEPESVARQIRRVFGPMPKSQACSFERAPRMRQGPQIRVWSKQTEQTHLCIGTYAIPRTHPHRFALELLHVILGANMSSRLFREVREKRGLVYEIATHIKRFHDTGAFVIYAGCESGKLNATVKTVAAELSRLRRIPVTRAELKRAKDYYSGQLLMALDDTMDHMLWMGEQSLMVGRVDNPKNLLSHLSKVTQRDIQLVARMLFVTPRMHMAVVGPVSESETNNLSRICRIA